jgi:hypothetical protein
MNIGAKNEYINIFLVFHVFSCIRACTVAECIIKLNLYMRVYKICYSTNSTMYVHTYMNNVSYLILFIVAFYADTAIKVFNKNYKNKKGIITNNNQNI